MLLLIIVAIEGMALLFGATVSEWVDSAFPDPWDAVHGPFDKILGWFHIGRVPVLILIVIFLGAFALTGFGINMVTQRLFGIFVTPWIAAPAAFVCALPIVRILGAGFAKVMPRDETYAVTLDSLVGRVATILGGTARPGYPAQGKVLNEHGQALYVMIEPDVPDAVFEAGTSVLLVRQLAGNRFAAIINPRPDLL